MMTCALRKTANCPGDMRLAAGLDMICNLKRKCTRSFKTSAGTIPAQTSHAIRMAAAAVVNRSLCMDASGAIKNSLSRKIASPFVHSARPTMHSQAAEKGSLDNVLSLTADGLLCKPPPSRPEPELSSPVSVT